MIYAGIQVVKNSMISSFCLVCDTVAKYPNDMKLPFNRVFDMKVNQGWDILWKFLID